MILFFCISDALNSLSANQPGSLLASICQSLVTALWFLIDACISISTTYVVATYRKRLNSWFIGNRSRKTIRCICFVYISSRSKVSSYYVIYTLRLTVGLIFVNIETFWSLV